MDAKEKSPKRGFLEGRGRASRGTRGDNTITTKLSQHIRRCKSRRSRAHVSTPCTDRETSKKEERKEVGEGEKYGKKEEETKR